MIVNYVYNYTLNNMDESESFSEGGRMHECMDVNLKSIDKTLSLILC